MRIALHIFGKDTRRLRLEIAVTVALLACLCEARQSTYGCHPGRARGLAQSASCAGVGVPARNAVSPGTARGRSTVLDHASVSASWRL